MQVGEGAARGIAEHRSKRLYGQIFGVFKMLDQILLDKLKGNFPRAVVIEVGGECRIMIGNALIRLKPSQARELCLQIEMGLRQVARLGFARSR